MKPVVHAILLADYIYQDRETGKKVIAGVFNRVAVRKRRPPGEPPPAFVPMNDVRQAGSPYAYINLREVHGRIPMEFRLVHLDTNEVLFRAPRIEVACDDPLATVELVLPVPPLPRMPGHYSLELLYEDELIGSHRVTVEEVE